MNINKDLYSPTKNHPAAPCLITHNKIHQDQSPGSMDSLIYKSDVADILWFRPIESTNVTKRVSIDKFPHKPMQRFIFTH